MDDIAVLLADNWREICRHLDFVDCIFLRRACRLLADRVHQPWIPANVVKFITGQPLGCRHVTAHEFAVMVKLIEGSPLAPWMARGRLDRNHDGAVFVDWWRPVTPGMPVDGISLWKSPTSPLVWLHPDYWHHPAVDAFILQHKLMSTPSMTQALLAPLAQLLAQLSIEVEDQ